MRAGRAMLYVVSIIYITVTTLRFEMVFHSFGTLIASAGLLVTGPTSMLVNSIDNLWEFWLAALVWLILGWWQFVRFTVSSGQTSRVPLARAFLAGVFVIAAVAPLLAPMPPHTQGALTTTKLLPPGSRGTIEIVEVSVNPHAGLFETMFIAGKSYLLDRNVNVEGENPVRPKADAGTIIFLLGTDGVGRDVFSRLLAGARMSLFIGAVAAFGALCIGVLVGFLAGYTGKLTDAVLMRFTDLVLAVPGLFLVVACVAFIGKSVVTLVLVLACTGWMGIARTVRTEVLKLRQMEFVLAARLLRQSTLQLLRRHIVPNIRPVVVSAGVLQFGNAILAEASLSFLGLGVQSPTASWGNMLGESLRFVQHAWWLAVFPGILLTAVLFAVHSVAESKLAQE